jgi:hypothetical protein
MGWAKLDALYRGRAFLAAHDYYCALAWILDNKRDWDCEKVF